MVQGRISPVQGARAVGLPLLFLLLLICNLAIAHGHHKFIVGHQHQWTYETTDWPNGKKFKEGDTLEFRYNNKEHDVVKVSQQGFDRCTVTKDSKFFTTGNDRIKLEKGNNYFICSISGHCNLGMKIKVTAN